LILVIAILLTTIALASILARPDRQTAVVSIPNPTVSQPLELREVVVYGTTARASSGGGGGCGRSRAVKSCARPEHGGQLVPGSGQAVDIKTAEDQGRASWKVTDDSYNEICIEFVVLVGVCEGFAMIEGRASALEKY
jgi:hypothetical protein